MSDNFIPLNQSTPVQNRWQHNNSQNQRYKGRGGGNRGGRNNSWNNSRSSYGSNSSNTSYGTGNHSPQHDRFNVQAYIHPSMLQDPWAELRREMAQNSSN
uniref:SFRICE_039848 n=1 Tax=Spodoptera frugiperda TaxID=7108 RepID=A0A2H1WXI3_SPOFR